MPNFLNKIKNQIVRSAQKPAKATKPSAKTKEKELKLNSFKKLANTLTSPRLSVSDRTLFAKRLSFLIKAGVTILESLTIIQKQTKSKSKRRIYDQLIEDVANGKTLSKSLEKFPKMFGEFAINIIKVGESSGILEQNLQYLSQELQKQHALRRKVVGALVYPIFITVATLGVTGLMTVYIFPKLMPIFTSLNVTLPFTTRALIFVSEYLRHWGILTIIGLIILGIIFFVVRSKLTPFRFFIDSTLLKIPLFGKMLISYNMANITRTMGLLLRSGVRIVESCEITADTTKNLAYQQGLKAIAKGVIKGEKISKCLDRQKDIFPDITSHMVSIGETTGNLSDTFIYLSEMYEAEVDETTRNLSNSIEPILMVFMGVIVGFVAVSVITPIYDITQHLQH